MIDEERAPATDDARALKPLASQPESVPAPLPERVPHATSPNHWADGSFRSHNAANLAGRPKTRSLTEILRAVIDPHELAAALYDLCIKKKRLDAIRYVYDRLDGYPRQTVEARTEAFSTFTLLIAAPGDGGVPTLPALLEGQPAEADDASQ